MYMVCFENPLLVADHFWTMYKSDLSQLSLRGCTVRRAETPVDEARRNAARRPRRLVLINIEITWYVGTLRNNKK